MGNISYEIKVISWERIISWHLEREHWGSGYCVGSSMNPGWYTFKNFGTCNWE
jgi:hypothetical protein